MPLVKSAADDAELVRQMNFLLPQNNSFQQWLTQNNLFSRVVWQTKSIADLQEPFPVLSLDYMRRLTMGTQSLSINKTYSSFFKVCTNLKGHAVTWKNTLVLYNSMRQMFIFAKKNAVLQMPEI